MKLIALALAVVPALAVVTVPTAQYDNNRSGENTSETILTPANVSNLAKLGAYPLDDAMYGQPLYVPALTINSATHNVVFAATMNNTVYAFDADTVPSAPLWSTNFGATWSGGLDNYSQQYGIFSTPVIDTANGYIYFVTVNNTPTYTLRQLNLLTGAQVNSVAISGSVVGTGAGTVGGKTDTTSGSNLIFNAAFLQQRVALTLANGNVYIGFSAGVSESTVWHGWVIAYNASTLSQVAIWCSTPNANGGGIWDSGGGFAVDGSGNLYFATGNGSYDGTTSFSQSIVKLSSTLSLVDWFTPSNESGLSAVDADLASGRVMLISGTNYLTFGSKDGRAWVIDSTNMGHLQGSGAAPQVFAVQSITAGAFTGIYGGTFFNSNVYFNIQGGGFFAFSFSGSTFNTTPIFTLSNNWSQVMTAGSSNAGSNPILWALTINNSAFSSPQPVVLRALNAATGSEYWNSGSSIGSVSRFADPTVANGKVYIATYSNYLVAFGIPNTPAPVSVTGVLVPAP